MAVVLLHDPAVRLGLRARAQALRPESPRTWGSLSVDQMLWHVNTSLQLALGERSSEPVDNVLTRSIVRWLVFHAPWPKGGAPTLQEMIAQEHYDFSAERERLFDLMERVAAKPLTDTWPRHAAFGAMRGAEWSRLQFRHIDHHLRQFGV